MALQRSTDPLVWIDCEMTGLSPTTDKILQICCFITDADLNLLDPEGWSAVIQTPKSALDGMGEWCTKTHASTGLSAACLASTVTADVAATELLAYIQKYVPETRRGLLAGNTIHADRAFLAVSPYDKVLEHLHYRIFDVSSIKEAVRRWSSEEALEKVPKKEYVHEARQDILESILEARYYRDVLFKKLPE